MHTLTATPMPPAWVVRLQFGLLTAGAALIAVGVPRDLDATVATGGAAFTGSMLLLGTMVQRAWARSLNKRHGLPLAAYGLAIASILVGAVLGAFLGSHVLGASSYLTVKRIHMTINVLGFASLTVVGTLVTLLPTVLRVRMPAWPGRSIVASLAAGIAAQSVGWAIGWDVLLWIGGGLYVAGAVGVATMAVSVARTERRWSVPTAGFHMMAAVAWFVVGAAALAWVLPGGAASFDRFLDVFLLAFVGGWLVQVLLGAWAYLLPTMMPGDPQLRRRRLAVFELGGRSTVLVLNAGIALMVAHVAGALGSAAWEVGLVLALGGAAVALAKAWLFPLLARLPVMSRRVRRVWGT